MDHLYVTESKDFAHCKVMIIQSSGARQYAIMVFRITLKICLVFRKGESHWAYRSYACNNQITRKAMTHVFLSHISRNHILVNLCSLMPPQTWNSMDWKSSLSVRTVLQVCNEKFHAVFYDLIYSPFKCHYKVNRDKIVCK